MDAKTLKSLQQALSDLESEHEIVANAINTIQALLGAGAATSAPRSSPKAAARTRAPAPARSGRRRPRWSPAMRKAAHDRMKRYWDQRRKGSSKS